MTSASVKSPSCHLLNWLCALFLAAGCTCERKSVGTQAPVNGAKTLPASNLEGVVKDSQGALLPDVLIIAWPSGKRGQAVAQARTSEEGEFLLPSLPAGRWSLLLEAAGLGTLELEHTLPSDKALELTVDGISRQVTGAVLDAQGLPQPGAKVWVGGVGMRWTREAVCDVQGIFSMRGLGFGRFTFRAVLGDKASPSTILVLKEGSVRPEYLRLTLGKGIWVQGDVVDDEGRFLPDVRLDLLRVPSDDLSITGRTDSAGHFRVGPLAPGRFQILPRLEGHVPLDAPEVQLSETRGSSFRVRMARTAAVHGKVVDEEGNPLPHQSVTVLSLVAGGDDFAVVPGSLPLAAEAAAMPLGQLTRPGAVRAADTNGKGEFWVMGLAPGQARLQILPKDRLPYRQEPLVLAPGQQHDLGTLTLAVGALLEGQVAGSEGMPLDAISVEASAHKGKNSAILRVSTDPEGRFSLRVPEGIYQVSAYSQDFRTSVPVVVHASRQGLMTPIRLQLEPRKPPAGR